MEIPRWVFWEVGDGEGGGREVGGRVNRKVENNLYNNQTSYNIFLP